MTKDRKDPEKKRRARREPLGHIAVRISPKDIARIDALAVKNATPWLKPTRSDMIRKLLYKALNAEDAEAAELLKDAEDEDEDEDEDEE